MRPKRKPVKRATKRAARRERVPLAPEVEAPRGQAATRFDLPPEALMPVDLVKYPAPGSAVAREVADHVPAFAFVDDVQTEGPRANPVRESFWHRVKRWFGY